MLVCVDVLYYYYHVVHAVQNKSDAHAHVPQGSFFFLFFTFYVRFRQSGDALDIWSVGRKICTYSVYLFSIIRNIFGAHTSYKACMHSA